MELSQCLEPKKAALINNFIQMSKGKSTDDMLPLMLAVNNKAKKEGITFSPDEIKQLIEILKEDMTPAERQRIDLFMQMMHTA